MTAYDFPAVQNGPDQEGAHRGRPRRADAGLRFNLRRPQFQDARVRQAFNLAFDFEHINKHADVQLYVRTGSFFDNSELKASGLPQGRELEILKEVQCEVPAEVFTTEYKNPTNATPEARRANLRKAAQLLDQAGWKRDPKANDNLLRDASGQTLKAEILLVSPTFERHHADLPGQSSSCSASTHDRARDRFGAISAPAADVSTSTSRSPRSPSRIRPATSSATSGARRRPTRKAAPMPSASRTRPSTS